LRAICFAPGLEWTDPASRARLVELAADLFPDHADELSLLKEVIARSEPAGWVEILYGACSAGPDRPTAIVAPYVFGLLRKAISAATLDEAEVRSLLATCAKVYRPDRQDPVLHDLLSATGVSADERVRRIGRLAGALVPSDTPARRAIEAFSKYCLCQPATYGAEFVRLSVMVLHSITWKEPGARHAIRRDVQWLFEQDTLNCPGPLPAKAPGNLEIVRATLRALE
jgi:hypothetical protein